MGQACLEIALIYRFADNFRMIVGTIMQSWHLPGPGSHLRFQAFVGGYRSFQLVHAAFHYLKKAYTVWRIVSNIHFNLLIKFELLLYEFNVSSILNCFCNVMIISVLVTINLCFVT